MFNCATSRHMTQYLHGYLVMYEYFWPGSVLVSFFCVFNKKSWCVIGTNFRIYNQRNHMIVGSNSDTDCEYPWCQ